MMRLNLVLLLTGLIFCIARPAHCRQDSGKRPQVNYITKEAVYINVGRQDGLAAGDTVKIFRKSKTIALVVITHISGKSSACRVAGPALEIQVGDFVQIPGGHASEKYVLKSAPKSGRPTQANRKKVSRYSRRKTKKSVNQVRGYLSILGFVQETSSGVKLSSVQPSLSGKLRIKNIAGTGVEFRLRQRTRFYNRSYSSAFSTRDDEWVYRFSEISLSYGKQTSSLQFGLGRVYTPHIRGLGLIDGAWIATKAARHFRFGIAAGTEPDPESTAFSTIRSKYGAFLAFETGTYDRQRLTTTVAFAGSYEKGTINREFVYLQNNFSLAKRFSVYQSVDIDINRNWRKTVAGQTLSFSNFYLTANLTLSQSATAHFSYDARKNIHTLYNKNTPDSLFDDVLREGFSAGLTVSLPTNMRLGANLFVRFQKGVAQNTISSSFFYHVRQFPWRGHSVAVRLSYINTQFTTGYRPTLSYRLPLLRKLLLNLRSGGYIYRTSGHTTTSYYFEVQGHLSLLRHYFLASNYRQYLDTRLDSRQFSMELGVNF